jgi:hypothetical protein
LGQIDSIDDDYRDRQFRSIDARVLGFVPEKEVGSQSSGAAGPVSSPFPATIPLIIYLLDYRQIDSDDTVMDCVDLMGSRASNLLFADRASHD